MQCLWSHKELAQRASEVFHREMKQSLWPLQHLPSETPKSADCARNLLVNTSIGTLCFLLTCAFFYSCSTLGWTYCKYFIFPFSPTVNEMTLLVRKNPLSRTSVGKVSEAGNCSFLHLTASFKLLFPAHQLTGEAESSLVQYAKNLVLVLALTPTHCLTFISMGIHFPTPALSSLALVQLNSSRERLLLVSKRSFT